jgi:hypothetical protein
MKMEVSFATTAFNCTEPREYFINDCCFGDDLCRWMMAELKARGVETGAEPGQEDFGWYFTFKVSGTEHCFLVGFQPEDPAKGELWHGWIERHVGFWKSVFGGRKYGVLPEAVELVDEVLRRAPEVLDVVWEQGK